jgi:hypothetical protein
MGGNFDIRNGMGRTTSGQTAGDRTAGGGVGGGVERQLPSDQDCELQYHVDIKHQHISPGMAGYINPNNPAVVQIEGAITKGA